MAAAATPVGVSALPVFKTILRSCIVAKCFSFLAKNEELVDITKGITTAEHEKRITINNTATATSWFVCTAGWLSLYTKGASIYYVTECSGKDDAVREVALIL